MLSHPHPKGDQRSKGHQWTASRARVYCLNVFVYVKWLLPVSGGYILRENANYFEKLS